MILKKISIIVPCYNQAHYLDEALQSVADQTYSNLECIIVNDGSADSTEEIALAWCDKDDRFIYIYKENGGLSSARNFGLERAKGKFIQFLDSDDALDKRKLELSLNEVHQNQDKNIVITNFRRFTENHNNSTIPFCTLLPELFNFRAVLLKWESVFSIPIHCGLFDIELFKDFKFAEELKAKEDWIMWLQIFQKKVDVVFINKPLAYYRLNLQSMSNDPKHMQENHIKAISYIKEIVSEKDYIDYLVDELKQKFEENSKLKKTIDNIKKTTSYKLAEKIKKIFFVEYFFKIIKK